MTFSLKHWFKSVKWGKQNIDDCAMLLEFKAELGDTWLLLLQQQLEARAALRLPGAVLPLYQQGETHSSMSAGFRRQTSEQLEQVEQLTLTGLLFILLFINLWRERSFPQWRQLQLLLLLLPSGFWAEHRIQTQEMTFTSVNLFIQTSYIRHPSVMQPSSIHPHNFSLFSSVMLQTGSGQ